MRSRLLKFGLIFASLSLLASAVTGCAGKQVDQNDPNALLEEAENDIKNDHYQIALDKLRTIKNKFPYAKASLDASLRIADVYFMQESYPEAAASYESFADLHPKHERVAYALFRAGKAYFSEVPSTTARDLTPAQKAVDAYTDFLRKFPSAPEVAEAKGDIATSRKLLAEKELEIGAFYAKRDHKGAARARYLKLIELYPETEAAIEARKRIEK